MYPSHSACSFLSSLTGHRKRISRSQFGEITCLKKGFKIASEIPLPCMEDMKTKLGQKVLSAGLGSSEQRNSSKSVLEQFKAISLGAGERLLRG